jgi:hypothetical protein
MTFTFDLPSYSFMSWCIIPSRLVWVYVRCSCCPFTFLPGSTMVWNALVRSVPFASFGEIQIQGEIDLLVARLLNLY